MTGISPGKAEAAEHASRHDCWNSIGIQGDASCPELGKRVHCRNCPTYSAAAAMFLDRELPQNYMSEWTAHFSQEKTAENLDTFSVILFRVATEWFALSTIALDEVMERRKIHSLPHRRGSAVAGLVNARGELIVCMSLRKILGLDASSASAPEPERSGFGRVLVVGHDGRHVAFEVDEVAGIHRYRKRDMKTAPVTVAKAATAHTTAVLSWRDRTVGFLDAGLIVQALSGGAA